MQMALLFTGVVRYNTLNARITDTKNFAIQMLKRSTMKTFNKIVLRLVACTLLCISLSACVGNNADALYHGSSAVSADGIYGYNAVDFDALGVDY